MIRVLSGIEPSVDPAPFLHIRGRKLVSAIVINTDVYAMPLDLKLFHRASDQEY